MSENKGSRRIVVGIDGSDCAAKALDWAAEQAAQCDAILDIETAYEPGYAFVTRDEIQRDMEALVSDAAARVAQERPDVNTTTGIHEASPATALIEASKGADLLVVGTRGLGGFRGLVQGSVSQQCCAHAHCSVTVVR